MNYVLVVFASATTANRVRAILRKRFDIEASLIQTPKSLPDVSCSYCLRLKKEHTEIVWKIVTDNKLASKGIYREKDYAKLK